MPDQRAGLRRYVLDVQCGCQRSVNIPLLVLAANRQLGKLTIADLVVLLRCRQCCTARWGRPG